MAKASVYYCFCPEKILPSHTGMSSTWLTQSDRGKKWLSKITSGKGLARGTSDCSWDKDS